MDRAQAIDTRILSIKTPKKHNETSRPQFTFFKHRTNLFIDWIFLEFVDDKKSMTRGQGACSVALFFFSCFCIYNVTRPRGYKTFFVLNSVEHGILNAHKYKNIKKFGLFKAQLSLECYFSHSYML